jgi:RNA polymerase sigma-70 factor (ECF subfamily)
MASAVGVLTDAGAFDADDALVEAARERREAFGAIYERYKAGIYRYLRTRTASRDDAADLTQQVFLRALDGLPKYRAGRAPFAAWLFRIARNAATDAHRRRRPSVSLDGIPDGIADVARFDPSMAAIESERLTRLRSLLAGIDPKKRELLALRFAGGLSAREIAPLVGRREEAVKKQLTRILATLKEHYHDQSV